jgi:hypothetical protein
MKNSYTRLHFLRMLILLVLPVLPAAGQEASAQIKNKIAGIQKSLEEKPLSGPNVAELKP